jgi:hypothetical protein
LQTPAVLHVPYTFFPDACGGTEVYVRGLAQRLAAHGFLSAVAAPGVETSEYLNDGLAGLNSLTVSRTKSLRKAFVQSCAKHDRASCICMLERQRFLGDWSMLRTMPVRR